LPRTLGTNAFFWSADSRSIAFFQDAQLNRIELDTGVVQGICPVPDVDGVGGPPQAGTWGIDGTILLSRGAALFRVDERGGEPTSRRPQNSSSPTSPSVETASAFSSRGLPTIPCPHR
jgi:hypothetical protein